MRTIQHYNRTVDRLLFLMHIEPTQLLINLEVRLAGCSSLIDRSSVVQVARTQQQKTLLLDFLQKWRQTVYVHDQISLVSPL